MFQTIGSKLFQVDMNETLFFGLGKHLSILPTSLVNGMGWVTLFREYFQDPLLIYIQFLISRIFTYAQSYTGHPSIPGTPADIEIYRCWNVLIGQGGGGWTLNRVGLWLYPGNAIWGKNPHERKQNIFYVLEGILWPGEAHMQPTQLSEEPVGMTRA